MTFSIFHHEGLDAVNEYIWHILKFVASFMAKYVSTVVLHISIIHDVTGSMAIIGFLLGLLYICTFSSRLVTGLMYVIIDFVSFQL